jgi:lysophospholipase L1-like esterase
MPLRFLALGDSYTIGESVPEADRWPNQLVDQLRGAEVADFAFPTFVAQTGWTADELSAAIASSPPRGPFELVSLLIGVNNQYRVRPIEEYRLQFRELLQTAIKFADGNHDHVLVLSIPDWGVTPFAESRDRAGIAAQIDAFNEVNREEAKHEGVAYLDITPSSRRVADDPSLVAEDGLHPSARMYRKWAELALPVVRSIFTP